MLDEGTSSDVDSDLDLFCYEDVSRNRCGTRGCFVLKEDPRWNLATYHLHRAINRHSPRETLWVHSSIAVSPRADAYRRIILTSELHGSCKWDLSRALAIEMPIDTRGRTLWLSWRFKKE